MLLPERAADIIAIIQLHFDTHVHRRRTASKGKHAAAAVAPESIGCMRTFCTTDGQIDWPHDDRQIARSSFSDERWHGKGERKRGKGAGMSCDIMR